MIDEEGAFALLQSNTCHRGQDRDLDHGTDRLAQSWIGDKAAEDGGKG